MESDGENTLVINDLLSFISCKLSSVPRQKLFAITKEFYPKEEITQAYKTLLECVPKTYCPTNPKKDLLWEIADLISKLPEEVSPIFVCQNVNNVPHVKTKKTAGMLTFAGLNLTTKQQQELRSEHSSLKEQISNVSNVVRQLKDQMEILVNKCEAYDREANLKKSLTDKAHKNLKTIIDSPEKVNDLMEEITGALIDTSRIRAERQKPQEKSLDRSVGDSPQKNKKGRTGKRRADDDFAAVSSSSDLQSSLSEIEDVESRETGIKDCFIQLGRFDDCAVTIKKEPMEEINGEDLGRSGRRPQRQKFSTFSDDFVVDFGSRSAKKMKK